MINVILFDIDGTLVLTGRAGQQAIHRAIEELYGIDRPAEVTIHGQTDRGIARALFAAHDVEDSDENWRSFQACYVNHLREQLPLRDGFVLPGVREVLETLSHEPSVELGLLTGNIEHGARLKLEHYGLMQFFSFGGYGDHHPDRNDVAQAARQAAEESHGRSLANATFWVIGDTPNDIRCGQSIGAKVLAVGTGGCDVNELSDHGPDHVVADLSDHRTICDLLCTQ